MAALDIRDEGRNEKYLGLRVYMGKSKEKNFCISQGQGLEASARMERKITVQGWEGDFCQGCGSGNSQLYHVMF